MKSVLTLHGFDLFDYIEDRRWLRPKICSRYSWDRSMFSFSVEVLYGRRRRPVSYLLSQHSILRRCQMFEKHVRTAIWDVRSQYRNRYLCGLRAVRLSMRLMASKFPCYQSTPQVIVVVMPQDSSQIWLGLARPNEMGFRDTHQCLISYLYPITTSSALLSFFL